MAARRPQSRVLGRDSERHRHGRFGREDVDAEVLDVLRIVRLPPEPRQRFGVRRQVRDGEAHSRIRRVLRREGHVEHVDGDVAVGEADLGFRRAGEVLLELDHPAAEKTELGEQARLVDNFRRLRRVLGVLADGAGERGADLAHPRREVGDDAFARGDRAPEAERPERDRQREEAHREGPDVLARLGPRGVVLLEEVLGADVGEDGVREQTLGPDAHVDDHRLAPTLVVVVVVRVGHARHRRGDPRALRRVEPRAEVLLEGVHGEEGLVLRAHGGVDVVGQYDEVLLRRRVEEPPRVRVREDLEHLAAVARRAADQRAVEHEDARLAEELERRRALRGRLGDGPDACPKMFGVEDEPQQRHARRKPRHLGERRARVRDERARLKITSGIALRYTAFLWGRRVRAAKRT
mmetsp:Transcript_7370/g.30521  ORF Transcript_7370/g.30521 Transcript_7370/m.30521 type:complete len:408 (+) Transcript_7370:879-2102(+)